MEACGCVGVAATAVDVANDAVGVAGSGIDVGVVSTAMTLTTALADAFPTALCTVALLVMEEPTTAPAPTRTDNNTVRRALAGMVSVHETVAPPTVHVPASVEGTPLKLSGPGKVSVKVTFRGVVPELAT
ncbi:MAG: hypothetical protein NVS4B8_05670 [Herpetosiphon sp.]